MSAAQPLTLAPADAVNVRTRLADLRRSRRSDIRARLRLLAVEAKQLIYEDAQLAAEDLIAGVGVAEDV